MATHSSVFAWRIPRTGEPWWAAVCGVTQSWTWLKGRNSSSSSRVLCSPPATSAGDITKHFCWRGWGLSWAPGGQLHVPAQLPPVLGESRRRVQSRCRAEGTAVAVARGPRVLLECVDMRLRWEGPTGVVGCWDSSWEGCGPCLCVHGSLDGVPSGWPRSPNQPHSCAEETQATSASLFSLFSSLEVIFWCLTWSTF